MQETGTTAEINECRYSASAIDTGVLGHTGKEQNSSNASRAALCDLDWRVDVLNVDSNHF
jgi:hypothetical protein